MSWDSAVTDGFEGLNQFFGQVSPYLFPILLIIFIGSVLVFLGKRLVFAVS